MAESAAQLFARLGAKQSLGTLRLPLFSHIPPPGLRPRDVVELCGGEGSGKTELLLNIVAECVLPKTWRGKELLGKGVEVVWLCTNFKFDLLRFVAILEGKVCERMKKEEDERYPHLKHDSVLEVNPDTPNTCGDGDYQTLITSCLARLHVIFCRSTAELSITLQSLTLTFLHNHPEVCGLVVDNVAEFCWVDRVEAGSVQGGKSKQAQWVGALKQLLEDHHLVVFAARPLLFGQSVWRRKAGEEARQGRFGSVSDDMMCSLWQQMVQYRFLLYTSHAPSLQELAAATTSSTTHPPPSSSSSTPHPSLPHSTCITIQQVSPFPASYKFTVSSQGVQFLSRM